MMDVSIIICFDLKLTGAVGSHSELGLAASTSQLHQPTFHSAVLSLDCIFTKRVIWCISRGILIFKNFWNSNCACSLGCPSQTCFFKKKYFQPISMVFGGWLEGSQKDFWFGQVLRGAHDRQKPDPKSPRWRNDSGVRFLWHSIKILWYDP